MRLGHEMEKKAIEIYDEDGFDLVHAHDWMAIPGATGIKKSLDVPMVFTIHSTQRGRDGVESDYQRAIRDLEWLGTYETSEVIAVGKEFSEEVRHTYDVPEEKLSYIPNGVDTEKFDSHRYSLNRRSYALDWEEIVLFVGRMYPQKGVRYLIEAMPRILRGFEDAKFVMVGSGATEYYRGMARDLVGEKVYFPGYVSDDELVSLMKAARVTVMPSVYEPFGIVPLESAASYTPTVGSYVGGIKETVIHEYTGLHSYPENPGSIAYQVERVLNDPNWSEWLGQRARERAEEKFRWERIARLTEDVYDSAIN